MAKPSDAGPNFASAEYAQQWQRGRKMRGEGSDAATELMLEMAEIREGDRVLEIASGTGDIAAIAAQRVGANGYILATDISASMVDLTAQTLQEAGVTNVQAVVMDADNLDLPEASFNVALCRSALMNFPNPNKTLAGVRCALKPSGKFAVTVFSTPETNPYHSIPLITASRLAKVPFSPSGQFGMFALSGEGVLEKCLTTAGFRDVAVRAVPVPRTFSSTAEAVSAMKDSSPRLQVLLNKLDDADCALAWSEIEQQLSWFEGPTGFEASGEWLVGVGRK